MKQDLSIDKLDQFQECLICFDKCQRQVTCKGPCKKSFCLKCVAQAKNIRNHCPNRCSSPFEIQFAKKKKALLACPYDSQNCNIIISDDSHLKDHYKICLFIPPEERQSQMNKASYRCQKGHLLSFITGEGFQKLYRPIIRPQVFNIGQLQICDGCSKQRLPRSICLQCSTPQKKIIFCTQCRFPPCSKTQCPMGHKILKKKRFTKKLFCDFCDVSASVISKNAFGFCKCDFDLCQDCYDKLPDNNPLIPLKLNLFALQKLSNYKQEQNQSLWIYDNNDSLHLGDNDSSWHE